MPKRTLQEPQQEQQQQQQQQQQFFATNTSHPSKLSFPRNVSDTVKQGTLKSCHKFVWMGQ